MSATSSAMCSPAVASIPYAASKSPDFNASITVPSDPHHHLCIADDIVLKYPLTTSSTLPSHDLFVPAAMLTSSDPVYTASFGPYA